MNLQYTAKESLILKLGFCFYALNAEETKIEKVIIIDPKLNYGFHAKHLLKALNSGTISQSVYSAITENENEQKQYFTIDNNVILDKDGIVEIVNNFGFPEIDTTLESILILKQLNERNYQLISKI